MKEIRVLLGGFFKELEKIRYEIRQLAEQQNHQLAVFAQTHNADDAIELENARDVPVNTTAELQDFNLKLADPGYFKSHVSYI